MIIGRIFYLLNASPFLLNLVSGLFTCLTVYFLYLIIFKFTKDRFTSVILPLFFAFGHAVWQQSVAAEIYTLNLLFFVLLFYLFLNTATDKRAVPMVFFISGLALSNHLTSILYVVPIMLFVLVQNKRSIRYTPLALISLTIYLYFPLRSSLNPVLDLFNPEGLEELLDFITGKAFHYRTLFFSGSYIIGQLKHFLAAWWRQFLILIPLGGYGVYLIKDKKLKNLLFIILILVFGYVLLYNIPDKQGYYLPFYAIWLVLTALGISKLIPVRLKVVLLIFPLTSIIINYQICDLSRESSLDDLCTSIYENLPDNSIIISDDYFVYCGILNKELDMQRQIVPISQFYLIMDWYIEHLSQVYPYIKIPEGVDDLLNACQDELRHVKANEYGEISKAYCHRIQREIIHANIANIPVYCFIYDDAAWPKSWYEFNLENRGLFYRFHTYFLQQNDYPLNFPNPEKYRVDKLANPDAIAIAKKFAAAYNRRAIYRFQAQQLSGSIEDFNRALEYYPGYHQVLSNLGLAYLNSGDTMQTIQVWQKYLETTEPGPQHDRIKVWYNHLLKLYPK